MEKAGNRRFAEDQTCCRHSPMMVSDFVISLSHCLRYSRGLSTLALLFFFPNFFLACVKWLDFTRIIIYHILRDCSVFELYVSIVSQWLG
jgi:hypothetical protein